MYPYRRKDHVLQQLHGKYAALPGLSVFYMFHFLTASANGDLNRPPPEQSFLLSILLVVELQIYYGSNRLSWHPLYESVPIYPPFHNNRFPKSFHRPSHSPTNLKHDDYHPIHTINLRLLLSCQPQSNPYRSNQKMSNGYQEKYN